MTTVADSAPEKEDLEDDEKKSTEVKTFKALYNFNGLENDELTFRKGQLIDVSFVQEGEWGVGVNRWTKEKGYFPWSYVEAIEEAPASTRYSAALHHKSCPHQCYSLTRSIRNRHRHETVNQKPDSNEPILALTHDPLTSDILSICGDSSVHIWSPTAGAEIATLELENTHFTCIAAGVLKECTIIACGDRRGKVTVWSRTSATEAKLLSTFKVHEKAPITAIAVGLASLTSALIVTGGAHSNVVINELSVGAKAPKHKATLQRANGPIISMALSPSSCVLACIYSTSSAANSTVLLWNIKQKGSDPVKLKSPSVFLASHVAFAEQQCHGTKQAILACGARNGTITAHSIDDSGKELDASTIEKLFAVTNGPDHLRGLAFSPCGRVLVTAACSLSEELYERVEDGENKEDGAPSPFAPFITFYDCATGEEILQLVSDSAEMSGITYTTDASYVALGGNDATPSLIDLTFNQHSGVIVVESPNRDDDDPEDLRALELSYDGLHVVFGGENYGAYVADVATMQIVQAFTGHQDWVIFCKFSPDKSSVLSGCIDSKVLLWRTGITPEGGSSTVHQQQRRESGSDSIICSFDAHHAPITKAAFALNGSIIATIDENSVVFTWNASSGNVISTVRNVGSAIIESLWFSDDVSKLIICNGETERVFGVETGLQQGDLVHHKVNPRGVTNFVLDKESDPTKLMISRSPMTGPAPPRIPFFLKFAAPIVDFEISLDQTTLAVAFKNRVALIHLPELSYLSLQKERSEKEPILLPPWFLLHLAATGQHDALSEFLAASQGSVFFQMLQSAGECHQPSNASEDQPLVNATSMRGLIGANGTLVRRESLVAELIHQEKFEELEHLFRQLAKVKFCAIPDIDGLCARFYSTDLTTDRKTHQLFRSLYTFAFKRIFSFRKVSATSDLVIQLFHAIDDVQAAAKDSKNVAPKWARRGADTDDLTERVHNLLVKINASKVFFLPRLDVFRYILPLDTDMKKKIFESFLAASDATTGSMLFNTLWQVEDLDDCFIETHQRNRHVQRVKACNADGGFSIINSSVVKHKNLPIVLKFNVRVTGVYYEFQTKYLIVYNSANDQVLLMKLGPLIGALVGSKKKKSYHLIPNWYLRHLIQCKEFDLLERCVAASPRSLLYNQLFAEQSASAKFAKRRFASKLQAGAADDGTGSGAMADEEDIYEIYGSNEDVEDCYQALDIEDPSYEYSYLGLYEAPGDKAKALGPSSKKLIKLAPHTCPQLVHFSDSKNQSEDVNPVISLLKDKKQAVIENLLPVAALRNYPVLPSLDPLFDRLCSDVVNDATERSSTDLDFMKRLLRYRAEFVSRRLPGPRLNVERHLRGFISRNDPKGYNQLLSLSRLNELGISPGSIIRFFQETNAKHDNSKFFKIFLEHLQHDVVSTEGFLEPADDDDTFEQLGEALDSGNLAVHVREFLQTTPLKVSRNSVSAGMADKHFTFKDDLIVRPHNALQPDIFWIRQQLNLPTSKGRVHNFAEFTVTPFPNLLSSGLARKIAVTSQHNDLLDTIFVRSAIDFQWMHARSAFQTQFYFYVAFLLLLTVCAGLLKQLLIEGVENLSIHASLSPRADMMQQAFGVLALVSLASYATFTLVNEAVQFAYIVKGRRWKEYFGDVWNLVDLLNATLAMATVGFLENGSYANAQVAFGLCLYFRWFGVLYFLQAFSSTGPLVSMIIQIIVDTRYLLLILLLGILATSSAFYILEAVTTLQRPATVYGTIFTMFNMLILNSSYEAGEIVDDRTLLFSTLRVCVFVVSMVFVPIILLNLMIALMSDSYENIQDKAYLELYRLRVNIMEAQKNSIFQHPPLSWLFRGHLTAGALKDPALAGEHRYLHVLLPKGQNVPRPKQTTYQGVLHSLKVHIDKAEQEQEDKMGELAKAIETVNDDLVGRVSEVKREMSALKQEIETCVTEAISSSVDMLLEKMDSEKSTLLSELGKCTDSVNSVKSELVARVAADRVVTTQPTTTDGELGGDYYSMPVREALPMNTTAEVPSYDVANNQPLSHPSQGVVRRAPSLQLVDSELSPEDPPSVPVNDDGEPFNQAIYDSPFNRACPPPPPPVEEDDDEEEEVPNQNAELSAPGTEAGESLLGEYHGKTGEVDSPMGDYVNLPPPLPAPRSSKLKLIPIPVPQTSQIYGNSNAQSGKLSAEVTDPQDSVPDVATPPPQPRLPRQPRAESPRSDVSNRDGEGEGSNLDAQAVNQSFEEANFEGSESLAETSFPSTQGNYSDTSADNASHRATDEVNPTALQASSSENSRATGEDGNGDVQTGDNGEGTPVVPPERRVAWESEEEESLYGNIE